MLELLERARAAINYGSPERALIAALAAELEIVSERCRRYVDSELAARRAAQEAVQRSQWIIKHLRAHRDALIAERRNVNEHK